MTKYIYLFRGQEGESKADFVRRLLDKAAETVWLPGVHQLKVALTEPEVPSFSVIPFGKKEVAILSIYGDHPKVDRSLVETPGFSGCYLADEAFPVKYEKDWEDGTITPGVCLLTLFRKKPGISREEFIDRWHNGHTPLSLKLHPLWHYSRNVIEEAVEPNSERWDGIVDEHFQQRSDLMNVYRFFGDSPLFPWHMWEVYKDVKGFLDYKSTETYLAREYVLKS